MHATQHYACNTALCMQHSTMHATPVLCMLPQHYACYLSTMHATQHCACKTVVCMQASTMHARQYYACHPVVCMQGSTMHARPVLCMQASTMQATQYYACNTIQLEFIPKVDMVPCLTDWTLCNTQGCNISISIGVFACAYLKNSLASTL